MEKLLDELKNTLKQDDRLFADDKLLKNKAIERALNNDEKLLELLVSNERLKEHFFTEAGEHLVFDEEKFAQFVSNKQFLPDSYTSFKNKIGLKQGKEYLQEKEEIELAWPYKDCILEGEQNQNDESRSEVFWNKVLAPDQVDTLLKPKVLDDFRRISESGENKVSEFNEDDNLIVKGNNLLALHSLEKKFGGEVSCIYIDPPYNTGKDSFRYNDNFSHSTWLTFMRNRLEIAKRFLRDDGVIFVHIDDNEHAYLKVLMDEIFGRENFIESITVVNNPRGRDYGGIANMHEFILAYSKTENYELYRVEGAKELKHEDEKGDFELRGLRNRNKKFNKGNRPNLFYPFYVNTTESDENGLHPVSVDEKEGWKEVYPMKSQGVQTVWRWSKGKARDELEDLCARERNDGSYRIMEKYRDDSRMARSVWSDKGVNSEKGTLHLKDLFGEKIFDHPKPETTLKRIIDISTKEGDLVLDFNLGSGTTAAVAHKMGRQYIGIEQMDYIEDVTLERMKKVIEGEQGGISEEVDWTGGGEFVYTELMPWNARFIEQIEKSEDKNQLQQLWAKMKDKAFLSYRLDIDEFEENAEEFEELGLEKQKEFLKEILDKNQLYVNYSEMEDSDYGISEEKKNLNKNFYGDE